MKKILLIALTALIFCACKQTNNPSPDFKIEFGKVSKHSVFSGGDSLSHWGGSVIKGNDKLYHMLYSRWPKAIGWEWVNYSEIAHATSASAFGPYKFKDVALAERGTDFWDGSCTHNPTVHKFNDKFYLYYMGEYW